MEVGGGECEDVVLGCEETDEIGDGLAETQLQTVLGAVVLAVHDLQHSEAVAALHKNQVAAVASHLLDGLVTAQRVADHPEYLLHLLLRLLLLVGHQIEQVHVTLHRNAEHRVVDLVHLGAWQHHLLAAAFRLLRLPPFHFSLHHWL